MISNIKKNAITFGIAAGIIIIVYSFALFLIVGDLTEMTAGQFKTAEVFGYLRYVILLLAVIFTIRTYKRETDKAKYLQLVKAGVVCAAVVGVLVGIMEAVYISMNPEFFDVYAKMMQENLQQSGASSAEIEASRQQIESYRWMQRPEMMGLFYFTESAVVGTIGSLLSSLLFKKQSVK